MEQNEIQKVEGEVVAEGAEVRGHEEHTGGMIWQMQWN